MQIPLLVCVLIQCALSAPVPLPLEEDFNIFHTKQENHEQRFLRVDGNKDKVITFDEFLHMELAYVDAKKEEFDTLDKNRDGKVSLAEYEEHFHEASSKNEKSRTAYFAKVFEDFDEDFNMALSREELERVLAERFLVKPRENFPKLFFKFDVDKSGGLDLTEYMKFDAEFPFDQTDPVGGKPSTADDHHNQKHTSIPNDADAAAIAAVLAQASPTLSQAPMGVAPPPSPGLHPVVPGAVQPAVPIKKH
uniref:EF-hand domain-containing protein n=1 Tax=Caenorhabditis japonica TaxID=281687 RepID=A0A8R1ELX3_CAEJA